MRTDGLLPAFAIVIAGFGVIRTSAAPTDFAVSPQYDSTHVYVALEDFDRFVASLIKPESFPG
jgi:hypothetical protein